MIFRFLSLVLISIRNYFQQVPKYSVVMAQHTQEVIEIFQTGVFFYSLTDDIWRSFLLENLTRSSRFFNFHISLLKLECRHCNSDFVDKVNPFIIRHLFECYGDLKITPYSKLYPSFKQKFNNGEVKLSLQHRIFPIAIETNQLKQRVLNNVHLVSTLKDVVPFIFDGNNILSHRITCFARERIEEVLDGVSVSDSVDIYDPCEWGYGLDYELFTFKPENFPNQSYFWVQIDNCRNCFTPLFKQK